MVGRRVLVGLGCTVLTMAVFGPSLALASPESGQETMQPQALDYVGVRDLRQIDPTLTGSGVRMVVVALSLTYLNNQPQNDYQPHQAPSVYKPCGGPAGDGIAGKA